MLDNRPPTPSAVKRQLRQEAAFGCCFCGHPFLQYHHIVAWAEDEHFRPEDMMVVCGQCHHLLTVGAITEQEQRQAKARPKNIVDGEYRGKLYVTTRELKVKFAGGLAIDTPNLIAIGDKNVVSAIRNVDGRILLSAEIYDDQGQMIAQLKENDWSMLPGAVWDFEAYPRHATVRTAPGNIAFAVDARNDEIKMRGQWYVNSERIDFTPTALKYGQGSFMGMNGTRNMTHIRIGQ